MKSSIYVKYSYGFEVGSTYINQDLLNSLMREAEVSILVFQNNKQIIGIIYPLLGAKQAITSAYNKCKRFS